MINRTLGHYEVIEKIGAGGMGEVYSARDRRLDRIVAIKVLPGHLSQNPELKQRFEREARAISQLSHPHICRLYDIGKEDGIDFLVMECLEGENLAQRLDRGPLPLDELLRTAIQIADALDKAHRQGVIHRDLKPGNIMMTPDGAKLLDFGLAKSDVPVSSSSETDLAAAPTVSSPLTAQGMVLGTFQYMAPEQVEGQPVDQRTDIFAFGAVLYEMATGKKAFTGRTQASLIASIIKENPPPIAQLQPMTPPALDRVVQTCLAKDPDDRRQSMHDLVLELRWIAEGGSQAGVPAPVAVRRRSRERLAWILAAAATALALVAAVVAVVNLRPREPPATIRFQIPAPEGTNWVGSPKVSPDGRMIAFNAGNANGVPSLWVRPLDALQPRNLPGTDGAARPFWSPDSRYLGFFTDGKLKKVAVDGGPPQTIAEARSGADGTWGVDGTILFDGGMADSIRAVPAVGGVPSPATQLDRERGEQVHAWPQFLGDSRSFTYLAVLNGGSSEAFIGSLDPGERRAIGSGSSRVEFDPAGFLVFARDRMLMAQPFDLGALKTTGEAFPIVESVDIGRAGLADFSISRNGVLAFQSAGARTAQLVWVDRNGRELRRVGQPADYSEPTVSPDGKRIAVGIADPRSGSGDLWILEPARNITSRFTFDEADDATPSWSHDGRWIAFYSDRDGLQGIYLRDASGAGDAKLLLEATERHLPSGWSTDDRYLITTEFVDGNITIIPMTDPPGEPIAWLATGFFEGQGTFSPDGSRIAYASNESGGFEIYVQDFPGPGGKWQISNAGGTEPQWSPDGSELYYLDRSRRLMAVAITTTPRFEAQVPVVLFQSNVRADIVTRNRYVVGSGGKSFLLVVPDTEQALAPTTVVVNWMAGN